MKRTNHCNLPSGSPRNFNSTWAPILYPDTTQLQLEQLEHMTICEGIDMSFRPITNVLGIAAFSISLQGFTQCLKSRRILTQVKVGIDFDGEESSYIAGLVSRNKVFTSKLFPGLSLVEEVFLFTITELDVTNRSITIGRINPKKNGGGGGELVALEP